LNQYQHKPPRKLKPAPTFWAVIFGTVIIERLYFGEQFPAKSFHAFVHRGQSDVHFALDPHKICG